MLSEAKPPQNQDIFAAAREKLQVGPVPDWVTPYQPDYGFIQKDATRTASHTLLLWNVQDHLERRANHIHLAMRLENIQAVQQESQWRVEFEPKTQTVILHWIKVRRGAQEIDHTHPDKIHFLQREAGLEGCVIDGRFTALLLLEDVRPGDILEWSYTMETFSQLLPDHRFGFIRMPMGIPIASLHFIARFDEARAVRWKSSRVDLQPQESKEAGVTVWHWECKNIPVEVLEPDIPVWHQPNDWVQISDCSDWGAVAGAMDDLWGQGGDNSGMIEFVDAICAQETELDKRVEKALRLVQDEFRYLSVNLEHGGYIPSQPDVVARRRYGDCKDLSFMLVQILRRLGVSAHPVLVSTALRGKVNSLLPSPSLFDHAIVQYELHGERRWVDVTLKNQGGGPLRRTLPNFRYGLVIGSGVAELAQPPAASITPGSYRVQESILLDTGQGRSSVAIVVTATGEQAETLRHQFASVPLVQIAEQRLQHCANRYRQARRIGELQYRDDREQNEFHLAEIFEVDGFLAPASEPGFCVFYLPQNLVQSSLRLPESTARRFPFALPWVGTIVHTTELQVRGTQLSAAPRVRIETSLVRFTRQHKCLMGSWSMTLTLSILDDVMLPGQCVEHQRRFKEIWEESSFRLILSSGYPAAQRNRLFGMLPSPSALPSTRTANPTVIPARAAPSVGLQQPDPMAEPALAASSLAVEGAPAVPARPPIDMTASAGPPKGRRRRSRHGSEPMQGRKLTMFVVGVVLGLFAAVIFFLLLLGKSLGTL